MASWNAVTLAFDHRLLDVRSHTSAYMSLHKWMNRNYPRTGRCEWCATTKCRTVYAVAEPGRYSRNQADWLELCYRCHGKMDGIRPLPARCGEQHGRAKLTRAKVAEIRRLSAEGLTRTAAGRRFGVAPSMISRIVRNEAWRAETAGK